MSDASAREKSNGENLIDRTGEKNFLTVGIGASAGGIKALKEFFAAMPADSGMAFVVILHLSQEHESSLAQILQSQTAMRVEQVTETVKVEPNNVYVIPPAKGLAMVDGHIKLTEPERIRGKRVPIDLFFRTLADAYGENGIAVVLSGTGSDGTLGLKRVKENGGIGIAQEPSEAEYDGMPRNAINTGLVDLILPVGEMPERIIGFLKNGNKIRLPKEKDEIPRPAKGKEPDALNEILAIVRVRTGHDFSAYKHATVLRRIARRLQVHALEGLPEYLDFLRENADEAGALQRDLLITVTNFFRDKEAFAVLEKEIIPKLFAGKTSADMVRVWSVGCATGEEAYSLAMFLDEYASRITDAPKIQIFASDINDEAIAKGRECFYEDPIAADVSVERLRHYFAKESGGYRVRKELRETVLFAPHNILRDPPFSKLDLIVCRNLLIYFNRETQAKMLGIFNFALRPEGYLFLGTSESAESHSALFAVADKKYRIYKARPVAQNTLPALPAPGRWSVRIPQLPVESDNAPPKSYGEIHLQLVEQFAPPSVLVNDDYEIVHVSENAGRFLRVAGGEPTRDLLKLIHPSLKLDLQSALFEVKEGGTVSEARNVRFVSTAYGGGRLSVDNSIVGDKADVSNSQLQPSATADGSDKNPPATAGGTDTLVNITVRLVQSADSTNGFYLVIFDESKSEAAPEEVGQRPQTIAERDAIDGTIRNLQNELLDNRDQLRLMSEDNDTSTEELRAQNEEMQAINEELRSTLEELETSKEELQSLNEELTTVNHELKDKVDEVTRSNSDLQNLMVSTDIGTIFLDRALRVKLYTPPAAEVFNIIPSDVGRPFEHLTHQLDYDQLTEDAGEVLKTLRPKEREARGGAGDSRYLVRLTPYRTLDDKIDGVVLTFIDITDLKRATDDLAASEERFAAIVRQTTAGTTQTDLTGKILLVNDRFCEIVGYSCDELLKMRLHDITHEEDLPPNAELFEQTATMGKPFVTEKRYVRKDGSHIWIHATVSAILDREGKPKYILAVALDITGRKSLESQIGGQNEILEAVVLGKSFDEILRLSTKTIERQLPGAMASILLANADATQLFDGSAQSLPAEYNAAIDGIAIGETVGSCGTAAFRREAVLVADTLNDPLWADFRELAVQSDLRACWSHPIISPTGKLLGTFAIYFREPRSASTEEIKLLESTARFAGIAIERQRSEEALRQSEEKYRSLFNSIDEGFCVVEMIFDENEKPVDYRFLEVNPMFEELTGLENAAGKTALELVPTLEGFWFETYGRVALTGEAARFENHSEPMNRWFDVHASRVGDAASREVAIVFTNITERKRMEEALRRAKDELEDRVRSRTLELAGTNASLQREVSERLAAEAKINSLLRQVVGAQEHERHRIARELHDEMGQQLTALMLGLKSLRENLSRPDSSASHVEAQIDRLQSIAEAVDREVDRLTAELRPTALDDLGLIVALQQHTEKWSEETNIKADFYAAGIAAEARLPPETETILYRIVQEALTNVAKHSRAQHASIILERRPAHLSLIVEDDGRGFDPDALERRTNTGRLGLLGMRERVRQAGGEFRIESAKRKGTSIFVRLPLTGSADDSSAMSA